ncbi:PIN domain-containing protein [Streptomyces corynorhini]|uniref:Type II toxin-antitoxin system VapC family toxin n=1 Tax=Streptomyces corynorhini TaxID=2282652 RepID=A0A370AZ95_9ACTN|nr:hypothetical protein [Streptomyces corynorhini]RDG34987.1 hypothetical protein DVH02_27710 [Streptomyces corynorhini]
MTPFLLDHSALLALGAGHRQLSWLVVAAAEGRAIGHVPALCLSAAEAERKGIGEHVASLPGLEVEPLDLTAALDAGALAGGGTDWQITHAVHLARPSAEWPTGRSVVSLMPDRYEGTGVDPIDPDDI